MPPPRCAAALLWGAAVLLLPASARADVVLASHGKPLATIVVPRKAPPPVALAATEIQAALKTMSGASLPVVNAAPRGAAIVLRDDPALPSEAFRIRVTGNRVEISGGGSRGTLYGAMGFLERVLGVRWFTPKVTHIPRHDTVVVPEADISEKPAFEYREPYFREVFDRVWAYHNRTNGSSQRLDARSGGGVKYGLFVHTFNVLVPPEEHFDRHPEYFSLIDRERKRGVFQLCLSNPEVAKVAAERLRQIIRSKPDATIFSVSQNDTGGKCQCDRCAAIEREEGAASGLLLRFVNAVADAVKDEFPHVLIDTLAYQWTEAPPKHVRPHPNVRIRLAPIGACVAHPLDGCDANRKPLANLKAWAKITKQLYIWHYASNFANYFQPLPDLDEIPGDIRLFERTGVVGVYYEGGYAPGGGADMAELKAYLMAKLLWNPATDPQAVIQEFLEGVYGPASALMGRWLDLLQTPVRTGQVHARIYDWPSAAYLDDTTLFRGEILFDAAELTVGGDARALDAVQRARLGLEYVQLMRMRKDDPARQAMARTVADKVRRYGYGEAREGEPIARFLTRIGAD